MNVSCTHAPLSSAKWFCVSQHPWGTMWGRYCLEQDNPSSSVRPLRLYNFFLLKTLLLPSRSRTTREKHSQRSWHIKKRHFVRTKIGEILEVYTQVPTHLFSPFSCHSPRILSHNKLMCLMISRAWFWQPRSRHYLEFKIRLTFLLWETRKQEQRDTEQFKDFSLGILHQCAVIP